jgi:hypothetical protein
MTQATWQDERALRHRPWGVVIVATLLAGPLVWLANLRFAIPLVMPPRPAPDYAVQSAWSLAGAAAVVLVALATVLIDARMPQRRTLIRAMGIVAMLVVAISCGAIALIASAP